MPKQCQAYYDALERGDSYAVHMLHIPTPMRSFESMESERRMKELCDSFEAEMKRIEETPNDILRLELEMKFGKEIKEKTRRPTLLERLFGKI